MVCCILLVTHRSEHHTISVHKMRWTQSESTAVFCCCLSGVGWMRYSLTAVNNCRQNGRKISEVLQFSSRRRNKNQKFSFFPPNVVPCYVWCGYFPLFRRLRTRNSIKTINEDEEMGCTPPRRMCLFSGCAMQSLIMLTVMIEYDVQWFNIIPWCALTHPIDTQTEHFATSATLTKFWLMYRVSCRCVCVCGGWQERS